MTDKKSKLWFIFKRHDTGSILRLKQEDAKSFWGIEFHKEESQWYMADRYLDIEGNQ